MPLRLASPVRWDPLPVRAQASAVAASPRPSSCLPHGAAVAPLQAAQDSVVEHPFGVDRVHRVAQVGSDVIGYQIKRGQRFRVNSKPEEELLSRDGKAVKRQTIDR